MSAKILFTAFDCPRHLDFKFQTILGQYLLKFLEEHMYKQEHSLKAFIHWMRFFHANNSHKKNIFLTANWTWVLSQRMRISRCKKANLLFFGLMSIFLCFCRKFVTANVKSFDPNISHLNNSPFHVVYSLCTWCVKALRMTSCYKQCDTSVVSWALSGWSHNLQQPQHSCVSSSYSSFTQSTRYMLQTNNQHNPWCGWLVKQCPCRLTVCNCNTA